jgi:hypothetical protein
MARLRLAGISFAVLWTTFMIYWSGDYSIVNILIFTICGAGAGYLWYWLMGKYQSWQHDT